MSVVEYLENAVFNAIQQDSEVSVSLSYWGKVSAMGKEQ
ncbi:hypothetical protein VCSRO147_2368 [Vibrio cholerae]|nr:hypothetical protein VCHE09_3499 [Vibrio paracholerae HE-09]GHX21877.1 hypothetical protein VCSRO107_1444 [Vibrio cholerae]GHX36234.1 hypothetical protein VCSRO62_2220 [Vibrio cholerae]GHX96930.1 hypothetical protein VCSRO111_2558 [Vibrio cholerae]GHY10305.1 hypothetical protein VCSRO112_2438 [Vibrio cholerae]